MYSKRGYAPTGQVLGLLGSSHPADKALGQSMAWHYGREYDQQEHEKGLQADEQRRRAYDSETERKKLGVLSSLLGGKIV